MSEICLITTCMGRLAHLQQSLGAAAAQPGCSCIVVDYSCPEQCGTWVEAHYPQVKVVRATGQTAFNISRARNLGAAAAESRWLCFFDADVVLDPHFAGRILPSLQSGHYYGVLTEDEGLIGPIVCARSDFERVGGYDEVFENWGHEDVDFYMRLSLCGVRRAHLPQDVSTRVRHDMESRVQHYAVKAPKVSQTINALYRLAKFDLMKIRQRDLTFHERKSLYLDATQTVGAWLHSQRETQWRIAFDQTRTIFSQEIASTLVYTLKWTEAATR